MLFTLDGDANVSMYSPYFCIFNSLTFMSMGFRNIGNTLMEKERANL